MKRTFLAVLALVAASLAPAAAAPDPVKINAILELTGTAAFLGQGEAKALEIAEGVINAHGGINGRPVQFVVQDDQSTPSNALQLMQGIIAQKAPAIIGTGFTQTCLAIMPLSKANGPVTYCITPGVHPPAGSFAFSANIGTESLAPVMLRYFKERGWTRFAFISSTDASGQDLENAVNLAMQRPEFKSMTMVAREHFNVSDISVAAQIERIKSAQPQAAIFWTAGTGFGTLLRNAHDAGLSIPIMGGNANENYAQLRQYKGFIPAELYFPSPRAIAEGGALPGPIHDAQTVYFAAFKKAGVRPDLTATMAWDPAMIVVDAYKHVGIDASPDKVRDYIEHLHDYVGVNGIYDFADGSQRGLGENACVILRYDGATETFLNASRPAGKLK
jgi:branched-chain amino acid transport system substrate-binding protein